MFSDISHWIRNNPAARHYGVASADFDGDGRCEFLVAGYGEPNRVLRWDGQELWDIAPKSFADADRATLCLIAADIDGDGREEIYSNNSDTFAGPTNQADKLFDRDESTGLWHDLFSKPSNQSLRNLNSGRSVAAIDRRGTGRYGFLVANYSRPFRLFELGLDGRLADLAPPLGLNLSTGGRSLWVGPLISERSDIFCGNERGPNFVYRNTGLGTFLEIADELKLADAKEQARGVTVLDADDDGRLDLVYGNWEGPHRLMIREPEGTFRNRASPALAMPSPIRNVIAADFDNDGYEELFFNNLGEANRLFKFKAGEWRLEDCGPAILPEGFGTGAGVCDIDGDGKLELLIAHGESAPQPLALFKVDSNDFNWLRVAPRTRFGAPARGATVRLQAGGRTQVRVICGGSGYLCQMEPIAHFGLGELQAVDEFRVTWPDGASMSLRKPPMRQTLAIGYPPS